jgi:hypothetical protein
MSERKVRHRRPVRSGKQSTMGEKTAERIRGGVISALTNKAVRFSLSGLIIIIILAIGVLSWYNNVYANTERVFWDMVENNLATNSITKEINQGSGNSSADEFSQLSFTPNPLVRDVKKVTGNSGQSTVHITVESIGTPKDT